MDEELFKRTAKTRMMAASLLEGLNASAQHQQLINDLMDLMFRLGELNGYLKKHL